MGKKIRARGATVAASYLDDSASQGAEADFRNRILGLCPGHPLDDTTLTEIYSDLCAVIGGWLSEWGQPEILPIATRLASSARCLERLAKGLAGLQTGIQNSEDIEFALLTRQALALSPRVGDLTCADAELALFQRQCADMAQVFWVAFAALKEERGKSGRHKLGWYDDFTAVLLKLADRANIQPNLHKDRGTKVRGGWLFEAAQVLENLLYPLMRTKTPEACGKRLERSLTRLKGRHRQNQK